MKKTIITAKAGNYNAIAYWCNALGETHCRGRFDIQPNELPEPLKNLFWKAWDPQYGYPCYLVDTEDGFGIALIALYDDEMAEEYGLSMDAMFQAAAKDMEDITANPILENAHVYLRIHPNLKGLQASYHTDLYKLQNSRLTVIPPESPISSYALMDMADKVLVMGSTMGAESCFWGKPVINLHKSEYYYLNVGYNPQTREELVQMLGEDLTPKPKDGALKYGYYYMATDERIQSDDAVPFNWFTVSFLGKKIPGCIEYLKLFGSSALFKAVYPRFADHCTRFFKNTVSFPG